jgi:monoamine oxidase
VTRFTRRRLIGGAAAAGVGAALPGAAEAATRPRLSPRQRKADVIVVGAGLAGLTAAREIARARKRVLVVEARGRVGGRTENHSIGGGEIVEVGGQWIGPTQDRLAALASSLGVETFKTYNDGNNVYYRNGTLTPYSASGPLGAIPPDPSGVGDAATAIQKMDSMAATVPLEEPWTAPNAAEWDGQTFETWKQANTTTPSGRFLLDLGIESVFSAEPRDLSLLWTLFYIAAAGNENTPGSFNRLINTADGAQDSRFVGGSQRVSLEAARRLGRRVLLREPVRLITQRRGGARVETDHYSLSAKRVIVTVPPALRSSIRFDPQLPPLQAQLAQRFPMGTVYKVMATYDKPFWRDAGLTGQATSDTGPVKITFDNTPPDGGPGVLLGFIEGEDGRRAFALTPQQRRGAVLESFARYFGDAARSPTSYIEKSWAQELYTGGCYGGYLGPGVLMDFGPAIRQPHGRVHWAGTETATYWAGYMDGAVRSGERAAREVLAAL